MSVSQKRFVLFSLLVIGGIICISIAYQRLANAQSGDVAAKSPDAGQAEARHGRVIELDEPEWRENLPLQASVSQSRIIAIGVALRNTCRRASNGQITTDYEVRLQEVMKGNARPDTIISVKMPGGLVNESDGNLLEARTRQVRKMQNGKRYILFLKNSPGGTDSYTPLRGSQGLYEIPINGTLVTHLGRSFLLAPADDGEQVSIFLTQVRDLVRSR